MTEIKLHTYGEKLIVSEKVTLAAGNINSAELHVTVDEGWAAYSNFSATFETKEYIEPVEQLMTAKTATEYVCVIPSEVLQHQGILEIGIRGITNDGEKAKTSSIAKYNIVKGASPGNITLNPTMDMYQQYLAAMDSKTAPLFNAYKEAMDAEFAEKVAELEEYKADLLESMTGTVLWENPNPTTSITTLTIPLDLSQYVRFVVICAEDVDSDSALLPAECCYGKQKLLISQHHGDRPAYRYITFANDGVTVTEEQTVNEYSNMVIPLKIIGYKY